MKSLKSSSERAEAKLAAIAIIMGIAVLYSAATIISGWMHDEMLERSVQGEEWLRQQARRPQQKFDTERPIRGQTLKF